MPEQLQREIEIFINSLPDSSGAQAFLQRLDEMRPHFAERDRQLLYRLLTLASHSPYLGESLLRHPEQIAWLEAETRRDLDRVKSTDQLSEELARFVTRMLDADDSVRLARFKRRELLRIYLRDCLGIATLSEVTEELSNLADVILGYALSRAHQEMVNQYGSPLTADDRGRMFNSELAIIALGKLGCRELNYSSDIDLLFLYSADGETSGDGRSRASIVRNKEFFTAVAQRVVSIIGKSSVEGSVFRIDLRLRPHGRDGDLVWEIQRATDYYHHTAQNWERQALIRARVSAGSEAAGATFIDSVRDLIFTTNSRSDSIQEVRKIKEKIDREQASKQRGFNVKLGPGGIREIEFIAQALQLKHGGREPWVRSAQTLIVLARLQEKGYLTEIERSRLSSAYTFLRTVEHRLQMEHGAQTHTVPTAPARLSILARRCGYRDSEVDKFGNDLTHHTDAVRQVYNRVFIQPMPASAVEQPSTDNVGSRENIDDDTARQIETTATRLQKIIAAYTTAPIERVSETIAEALHRSINRVRALRNLGAWAESFGTYTPAQMTAAGWTVNGTDWLRLIENVLLVSSSQYLSQLLVSRPGLAGTLTAGKRPDSESFGSILQQALTTETGLTAKANALRRAWHRIIIAIGHRDMAGAGLDSAMEQENESRKDTSGIRATSVEHLRAINDAQTALAESSLRIALDIAYESLGFSAETAPLPLTVLGLGRLGHAGMDYGSDLDLIIIFDDRREWRTGADGQDQQWSNPQEFHASLSSHLVRILSSITRDGLLYRTDLRLRPEGKSGPVAVGLNSLVAYITNRASAWEHSAYLKSREVAGDQEFGRRARESICEATFDAASKNHSLREELREMRSRIVREKTSGSRPNIKWGPGGMGDVYFITRYLQLRDRIYYPPANGTRALIAHLNECKALDENAATTLFEGYSFLRTIDHWMRLLLDRPTPVLPASTIALTDISRAAGIESVEEFERMLVHHTSSIRRVYEEVFGGDVSYGLTDVIE